MSLLRIVACMTTVVLSIRTSNAYECPSYEDIVQTSLEGYRASELDGGSDSIWYMVATNEPTLPPICTCGINNITVSDDELTYEYTNTDICQGLKEPFQIHIGGEINGEFPGNMKENAIIHNHQLKNLDPNMVFHVERDGNKDLDVVYTYACLGHGLFSFNVLAKTSTRTTQEIESMIAEVDNMIGHGILKIEKVRIVNQTSYETCEV
ncbi:hypothetical protein TrCOL_g9407 [Triparma columacea]|uniref:Uncharacterized protein n=1 Tax=Triparma columacea TaxID=722753 RepID=A0A9W7G5U8_9STRA|nr:hypothetical protein TrCOL_g9407 [Triparma columacea]